VTLREQLIRDEGGYQRYVYQDSLGFWTVGYGRCVDRKRGKGISEAEAALLLDNDIRDTTGDLLTALPWVADLDEVRKAALINLSFNLGIMGLLGFKNMLAAAKENDWETAAQQLLESKYARQVGARATRLAEQLRTAQWQ
jgi:lysozyme